jgi:hypothetical protein
MSGPTVDPVNNERFFGLGNPRADLELAEPRQRDAPPLGERPGRHDHRDLDAFLGERHERMGEATLSTPGDAADPTRRGLTSSVEPQDPVGGGLAAVVAEERGREQSWRGGFRPGGHVDFVRGESHVRRAFPMLTAPRSDFGERRRT